jgi:HlyD family secretion protein
MTSQAMIVTSSLGDAVSVPIQSVVERIPGAKKGDDDSDESKPKKKYVFLARNGKVAQVEVRTGISDATHVAILSGLKNGDPVVSGPFRTLKNLHDGDSVEVVKENEQPKPSTKGKDQS